MLDKEFKKKWTAALRSGKYKQGKGYLRTKDCLGDKFCCIGVAFDIEGFKWVKSQDSLLPMDCVINEKELVRSNALGKDLFHLFPGMTGPEVNSLMTDNDEGADFEQIADRIDKEF